MSLKIGIVGLPNVGKSTLFNALTRTSGAQAANYPFCTINPNVGIVEVPDPRLKALADLVKPEKVIPAVVEFVDIAGLVKGASEGEGLGNKFLANIRECHAIAQVLRFFEDPDITHVHGGINPRLDMDVVQLELILADLDTVSRRLSEAEKKAKSGDKKLLAEADVYRKVKTHLEAEKLAINLDLSDEEKEAIRDLHLLTDKPFLYIANVKEAQLAGFDTAAVKKDLALLEHQEVLPISAKVEEDLISFSPEEAQAYLSELGLKESGLHAVIRSAYRLLGLQTYFTAGPKEVRAWTVHIGAKAPEAAGVIHTDFEKGFIKAETIAYQDYIEAGGELVAKEKGKMRMEGKEYVVKDGDIMHFKFNV
ncbi:redox-regulated ATPase YchF [Patescibacteria group bacterium]|nr:redox-regulated ATPase YchF [Patescibacteria group bacterium]MBU1016041.1 redox-regulated ATPase YchF [Patescibacteria group bacterium]MBU1685551.1 redox-regulated ATPase YchF [Patescibacteria group bacterium]MBU1938262.1 redox-regulated ATPase YchF [Patescibacteria group bacterium]